MRVSLRPRHPSEIAAEQVAGARRLPSLALRRGPNLMLTVLPAIIMAAAVYIGLVYVDKIARRVATSYGQEGEAEQTVRRVDGVVNFVPVLERQPPPSPELLLEQARLAVENEANATRVAPPVLIPKLEVEPLPLERLRLTPLSTPDLARDPTATREVQPDDQRRP